MYMVEKNWGLVFLYPSNYLEESWLYTTYFNYLDLMPKTTCILLPPKASYTILQHYPPIVLYTTMIQGCKSMKNISWTLYQRQILYTICTDLHIHCGFVLFNDT